MFKKITNLSLVALIVLLNGCNLLEVKVDVTQRSIMDKGDNTEDSYSKSGDNTLEEEQNTAVIKTIP